MNLKKTMIFFIILASCAAEEGISFSYLTQARSTPFNFYVNFPIF